jgi:hypothetical protein
VVAWNYPHDHGKVATWFGTLNTYCELQWHIHTEVVRRIYVITTKLECLLFCERMSMLSSELYTKTTRRTRHIPDNINDTTYAFCDENLALLDKVRDRGNPVSGKIVCGVRTL